MPERPLSVLEKRGHCAVVGSIFPIAEPAFGCTNGAKMDRAVIESLYPLSPCQASCT